MFDELEVRFPPFTSIYGKRVLQTNNLEEGLLKYILQEDGNLIIKNARGEEVPVRKTIGIEAHDNDLEMAFLFVNGRVVLIQEMKDPKRVIYHYPIEKCLESQSDEPWTKLVYLCVPYTHSDRSIVLSRYKESWRAAIWGWVNGYLVYSPIAYTHPIDVMSCVVPYEAWLQFDRKILQISDEVWVLKLPGYENSRGVKMEVTLAEQLGIPVKYIEPEEIPEEIIFSGEALAGEI